jgi:lysyl-tRNA synthetase class 2
LAAGEQRIFDFARVFRNRERGALHAPEFTMLEWYRGKEPYASVMADCISVLRLAAETTGIGHLSWRNADCDPHAEPERISVCEAFHKFTGIDLTATLTDEGEGLRDGLSAAADAIGIVPAGDDTWSDIFSKILVARVEQELGRGRPSLLYEYPRSQAALARPTRHDPRFAERFELYVCGVELANGFGELTDAYEQRRRFEAEMAAKERVYGERYPIDEDFLAALVHMPEASGVALGFDRLVMLATGSRCVDDVLWTPFPE